MSFTKVYYQINVTFSHVINSSWQLLSFSGGEQPLYCVIKICHLLNIFNIQFVRGHHIYNYQQMVSFCPTYGPTNHWSPEAKQLYNNVNIYLFLGFLWCVSLPYSGICHSTINTLTCYILALLGSCRPCLLLSSFFFFFLHIWQQLWCL